MKNITSLCHLPVSTLLSYGNDLQFYIIRHADAADLEEQQYTTFLATKQKFEEGYNKERRSKINLKKTDNFRDQAFLYLKHLVLAGCYSPKEEVQQEAEKVKQLIYSIGPTLYRRKFIFETTDINKLLFQLKEKYYAQAIELLSLDEAITNLDETNKDFENSDFERGIERFERKQIPTPTRERKAYEYAIRGLWEYIDAQAIVNPQSGWVSVKKHVEMLNANHKTQLKRHYTFIKKRKEKMNGDTLKAQEDV